MKNKWILNFLLIALSFNAISPLLAKPFKKENAKSVTVSISDFSSNFHKVRSIYSEINSFLLFFIDKVRYGTDTYKSCKYRFDKREKLIKKLLDKAEPNAFEKLSNPEKIIIVLELKAALEKELDRWLSEIRRLAKKYPEIDPYNHIEKVLASWQLNNWQLGSLNSGSTAEIHIRNIDDCYKYFAEFSAETFEIFTKNLEASLNECDTDYKKISLQYWDFIQSCLRIQTLKNIVDDYYQRIKINLSILDKNYD